jgi:transcriptional regulator with XRE-family HTH domain
MSSIITQRFIHCHNKLKEENRVRSSRQFAMALEYLPQSLSEILKGRRDVTIDLLRKAVEVYKINPVFLYTGEGPLFMSEDNRQDFRTLTVVTDPQNDELLFNRIMLASMPILVLSRPYRLLLCPITTPKQDRTAVLKCLMTACHLY